VNETGEMDERTLETQLTSSFERLTRRGDVADDVRHRAARRMRDAFDGTGPVDPPRRSESSELLGLLEEPLPERSNRWTLLGAAAVVAVLVVGLLAVVSPLHTGPDEPANGGATGSGAFDGRYTTDALGGTVELVAPSNTQLTRLEPGVVELTLGPSPDATTVTIAHPTALAERVEFAGIATLAELLDATPGTQRVPSAVGDAPAQRWRWLSPTGAGPCRNGACTDLFASPGGVGVVDGRTTDIWVVETAVGTPVVVIASLHPDDFDLSPPESVAAIVDSLDLRAIDVPPEQGSPEIERVEADTD
jgi:hypothetical protein